MVNCCRHFLILFLVIGFVIIKNKWQQYLIHIGKISWSICASGSLYQCFCEKFRHWLTKLLRSFLWSMTFSFITIFYFFNMLRICLTHDLFCFCIKPPSRDPVSFFSRIDKLFVQFFLHYSKHYFPMPCWSWSPFLFLNQLFTFQPVSYLLSIYFKFSRSYTDIFPITIVIMNSLVKDLLDDLEAIFSLCRFD